MMFEATYNMLKEHDKAFVDGFLCAIKYMEDRGDLVSYDFLPALADDSTIAKVIDESVKVITESHIRYLRAHLNDLMIASVESYKND